MAYTQYKKHLYNKENNSSQCQTRTIFIEYAKKLDDVNCQLCIKYINKIKAEHRRREVAEKAKELRNSLEGRLI